MMKKFNFIFVLVVVIGSLLSFPCCSSRRNTHASGCSNHTEEQSRINLEAASNSVEFIYTEQELRDTAKWKDNSGNDIIVDAMYGDGAALYALGGGCLLGLGCSIDVRMANVFFANSASLGFAPALEQIFQMYIDDESNAFLAAVYKNLTISFGHTEFAQGYHDFRSKVIEYSGKNGYRILNEIERIAMQKKIIILKNKKYSRDKQGSKEVCWGIITKYNR